MCTTYAGSIFTGFIFMFRFRSSCPRIFCFLVPLLVAVDFTTLCRFCFHKILLLCSDSEALVLLFCLLAPLLIAVDLTTVCNFHFYKINCIFMSRVRGSCPTVGGNGPTTLCWSHLHMIYWIF